MGNCPLNTTPPREGIQNHNRTQSCDARQNRIAGAHLSKENKMEVADWTPWLLIAPILDVSKNRRCMAWQAHTGVILLDLHHYERPKDGEETGTFLKVRFRTEKSSRYTLRHFPDRRNTPNEILEKACQGFGKEIHQSRVHHREPQTTHHILTRMKPKNADSHSGKLLKARRRASRCRNLLSRKEPFRTSAECIITSSLPTST